MSNATPRNFRAAAVSSIAAVVDLSPHASGMGGDISAGRPHGWSLVRHPLVTSTVTREIWSVLAALDVRSPVSACKQVSFPLLMIAASLLSSPPPSLSRILSPSCEPLTQRCDAATCQPLMVPVILH